MRRNRNTEVEFNEGEPVEVQEDGTVPEGTTEGEGGSAETAEEKAKRGFHAAAVTSELPADFQLPAVDTANRSNNNPITNAVRAAKDAHGVWQQTHVESSAVDQARQHLRSSANRLSVGVHIHPAVGDSDQIDGGKVIYWHTKEKAERPRKAQSDETATSPESEPVADATV